MAHSADIYGDWLQYHGRKVTIDGLAYRLKCNTYTARYPRTQQIVTVHAEPINKRSRYYRETRELLGDDWSTDVLDSSIELQAQLMEQLKK